MAKRGGWKVDRTLLIVAEGFHDTAFLTHVRSFDGVRGSGLKVTVRNARGKGALAVINHAARLSGHYSYDKVAVFFDTDTDWDDRARKVAKKHRLCLLQSDPCFEALLLRVLGVRPSTDLKTQFAPYVNGDPMSAESYRERFGVEVLRAARENESTIHDLLALLGL